MACRVEYAAMTDRDRLIARVLKAAAVFANWPASRR